VKIYVSHPIYKSALVELYIRKLQYRFKKENNIPTSFYNLLF